MCLALEGHISPYKETILHFCVFALHLRSLSLCHSFDKEYAIKSPIYWIYLTSNYIYSTVSTFLYLRIVKNREKKWLIH